VSSLIEGLAVKYPKFKMMLDTCDSQIFFSIPALVVLHNLGNVVKRFGPSLRLESLVDEAQDYVKEIEEDVLELTCSKLAVANRIKVAGVQLSREKAQEWN
jgi:hypothetical protein